MLNGVTVGIAQRNLRCWPDRIAQDNALARSSHHDARVHKNSQFKP